MTERYLPIIYVRGYAGTQGDVERSVDDTFYGFNEGSTHIRIGSRDNAQFFAFESPLVRLMTDHGYRDVFHSGAQELPPATPAAERHKTVWVYRYYDVTSRTFERNERRRLEIEEAAEGLRARVATVKQQTGAPRVLLVAHSMGGLICRSLIQMTYPKSGQPATEHIDKLFTYGTPHGGIHFAAGGGALDWVADRLGWNNSDDFSRDRMYQYLTPGARPGARAPEDFRPYDLGGAFPPDRVFCMVGTNAKDYGAVMGLSSRAVGAQSDGLVQMRHAYARGSHRAYTYRSHSGRYGLVNSEEAYQNLQRFLFGGIKVEISLRDAGAPPPGGERFYQADVTVAIRGLPILMHEQRVERYCPVRIEPPPKETFLYTAFLMPERSATGDGTCRYALHLAVNEFRERNGLLSFADHLEQTPVWEDTLLTDLRPAGDGFEVSYAWRSQNVTPSTEMTPLAAADGSVEADVPLPALGLAALRPRTKLHFKASRWA